jgi:hypothetical protein
MDQAQLVLKKRDERIKDHLEQYAPVWLVDEKLILEEEAVQFNVVFEHIYYGWVNRRYRYDSFNNVLYHKGQRVISENEALTIQEREPYLAATVADIPGAYGG